MRRRAPHEYITGAELRTIRTLLGLSQDELGQELDLTYRQVQRYEARQTELVPYLVSRRVRELKLEAEAEE